MNMTGQVLHCLIAACLLAVSACTIDPPTEDPGETPDIPMGDPILGRRITEGVVFDGKLWLRGGSGLFPDSKGGLVSFDLSDWSRYVAFESGVIDMERSGGMLWVLRSSSPNGGAITVTTWKNGVSQEIARFNAPRNDLPIALLIDNESPVIVSQTSVRTWRPEMMRWRVMPLRGRLQSTSGFSVSTSVGMPANGTTIYVGHNAGEFGGGLQKINLEDGSVTTVQKRDESRRYFYGGPLDIGDQITAVIPDPERADCVLSSVGLVHLGISSGRIVRVCDAEVDVAFENTEEVDFPAGKFVVSEAFFGLAQSRGTGYWAVGITGLYQFTNHMSAPAKRELPDLMAMDQIYLSRDIPGAIILRTDINWAVSTSGYTPLVIPLEQ